MCPAAAQADSPIIRAERLVEIGGDESPVVLSAISDASFDASGRLVVLDHLEGRVYVVRNEGTLAASFARKGAGPGEFRGLDRLGWKRDTLWIYDAQQGNLMFRMRRGRSALDTLRWLTRLNSELSLRMNFLGAPADMRAMQPLSAAPLSVPRKHGGPVVVERSGVSQPGVIPVRVQVYSDDGAMSADRTLSLPARPMTSKIRDEVRARLCVSRPTRASLDGCSSHQPLSCSTVRETCWQPQSPPDANCPRSLHFVA